MFYSLQRIVETFSGNKAKTGELRKSSNGNKSYQSQEAIVHLEDSDCKGEEECYSYETMPEASESTVKQADEEISEGNYSLNIEKDLNDASTKEHFVSTDQTIAKNYPTEEILPKNKGVHQPGKKYF